MCDFAYKQAEQDTHYAYKIIAVNGAGESPESEIFSFGLWKEERISEDGTEDKADEDMGEGEEDSLIMLWVACIAGSVLILGAALGMILYRRRK